MDNYVYEILTYFYKSFEKNKTYCSRLDLEKSLERLAYNDNYYNVVLSLFYKYYNEGINNYCKEILAYLYRSFDKNKTYCSRL